MERKSMNFLILLSCFLYAFRPSVACKDGAKDDHNVYLVLVKDQDGPEVGLYRHTQDRHNSLLSSVLPNHSSKLVYSYQRIINGFAARLTKSEVETLSKQDWFLQAIPSRKYKLLTTHSPTFLGLRDSKKYPKGVWSTNNMGEGMIIGVLDGGISPGHPSFKDEGLPSPPAKWKGHCDFDVSLCNNKLIGARTILNVSGDVDHLPPNDTDGHGTHVSSTAAGAFVRNVAASGSAMGTASGMAPRAHLAIYKICNISDVCHEADILKAIEIAVDDGVDVLSISLGVGDLEEDGDTLSRNAISVGAFYAMLHGVFVSCAGSNDGPLFGSITNDIPWLLTVGASSTDRRISSTVQLGNGVKINGETLTHLRSWSKGMVSLIFLDKCTVDFDKSKIQGKIVVCDSPKFADLEKMDKYMRDAGVEGIIMTNGESVGYSTKNFSIGLPSSYVSYADGMKIKSYIDSSPNPSASFLFKGSFKNFSQSPAIADFSSRGPSARFPRILKPDIVGPGIDIIAAFPPTAKVDGAVMNVSFIKMSGTSMSAPHLAGIAALIKKAHPDWSPAAIKSAIMTTAYVTDRSGKPITDERGLPADFYSLGAGHVDPIRAMDPGLVYDAEPKDYIPFLCGLGISDTEVRAIISPLPAGECSKENKISQEQLNYPSIVATLKFNSTLVIKRTVKNVGDSKSTYDAKIDVPSGVFVRVTPTTLDFNKINEKRSFTIAFTWNEGRPAYAEGQLLWISRKYTVRSPIVINKAFSNGSTSLPYDQSYLNLNPEDGEDGATGTFFLSELVGKFLAFCTRLFHVVKHLFYLEHN